MKCIYTEFSGVLKIWESQGIKFEVRENLEKSGIFPGQGIFCSLVVFTPSLSIRMSNYFLGLPETAS